MKNNRWWLIPLSIFIGAQIFSTLLLAYHKSEQVAVPVYDSAQYWVTAVKANPPWQDYVTQWNGWGYREVATNWYPDSFSYFDTGRPNPSVWAFFPMFPFLCSLLMSIGIPFGIAGIIISLSASLTAVLLLYRWILSATGDSWKAALAVSTLLLWPSAPLFQLAYAESVALLLLVILFKLVTDHKYFHAIPIVLLLGLTRPIGPPDVALLLLHGLWTGILYVRTRNLSFKEVRQKEYLKKLLPYGSLLIAAGLAASLWVIIGYVFTGQNAYFIARDSFVIIEPFTWFKDMWTIKDGYPFGHGFSIILFLAWSMLILLLPSMRNYPLILRLWPLLYTLYIFSFTSPVGNEYRYLMLAFFIFPFTRIPGKKCYKIGYFVLVAVCIIAALVWQNSWVEYHWIWHGGMKRNV